MQKRPFSDEDIERLKVTPYVAPKPLSFSAIALLLLFWPVGLYYLISKGTPEYRLSRCKTDVEREDLFAYLKSDPKVVHQPSSNMFTQNRCLFKICKVESNYERFCRDRYIVGTGAYNLTHTRRY